MELHKNLPLDKENFRPDVSLGPTEYFKKSLDFTNKFYSEEIKRISSIKFDEVNEDFFFKEYIWVVHASGFSAKAVSNFLPRLINAYGPWEKLCFEDFQSVFSRVKLVCNNHQKAKAVWSLSKRMRDEFFLGGETWDNWKKENLSDPKSLSKLPFIGKITCYHLGRNIGLLDCVKPDLHLVRMMHHWGFKDCESMCIHMRDESKIDAPLGIIDLALWYTASIFGTLYMKKKDE